MSQLLAPDAYASLVLPDMFIEEEMQQVEAAYLVEQTKECNTVLDLGYGQGIICNALDDAGRDVTVVDGSHAFCKFAEGDGLRAVHSMFEDFQSPTKYDAVIASFILEHVADPAKLLTRIRDWTDKLIVVVGNANSYHRQLAVRMGLQPDIYTLSERDKTVGHYRVYDEKSIRNELCKCGWMPLTVRGIMLKPLPNSMMTGFDPALIKAMCEIPVPREVAANLVIVAQKL